MPLAHWIWGGGFLQQWGVVDFGGGMVVHAAAGFSALASVFVVRKRVFAPGEEERPSNIPLIAIGLGLLWFGWLGDNPAGALKADGVAAQAFVNTFIAGGCAMIVWLFTDWVRTGKVSMVGSLTGVLAGLVAVTPCAGYVPTWAAVCISLAAGWICYGAVLFRKSREWDDSLDVWGVHGVGGLFGYAHGGLVRLRVRERRHRLLDGDPKQFGLQLIAVAHDGLTYTFVRDVRDLQGDRRCVGRAHVPAERPGARPRRGVPRRDRLRLTTGRDPELAARPQSRPAPL